MTDGLREGFNKKKKIYIVCDHFPSAKLNYIICFSAVLETRWSSPVDCRHSPQWFRLVPSTRFGLILRGKSSKGRYFFMVWLTAKTKSVLKPELPNNDYMTNLTWTPQKNIVQNLIWKNFFFFIGSRFFSSKLDTQSINELIKE